MEELKRRARGSGGGTGVVVRVVLELDLGLGAVVAGTRSGHPSLAHSPIRRIRSVIAG
jgi:hypothetical protein